MRIGAVLFLIIIFNASLTAAEKVAYPCQRLAKAPTLDGKLEPEVWDAIPEAGKFFPVGVNTQAADRPIFFKAAWTPQAIYFAVRCTEPAPETMRTLAVEKGNVWDDDSVEICIAPPGSRIQYLANSAGARWQAKGLYVFQDLLGAWQVKADKDAKGWTLEIMIPFEDVGATPVIGVRWIFGIERNIPRQPPENFSLNPCLIGDYQELLFLGEAGKAGEKATALQEPAPTNSAAAPAYDALMHFADNLYKAGDYCGAQKAFRQAAALAATEALQGQALLKLGHTLFALGNRWAVDQGTRPNRGYARSVYEKVVNLKGAVPAARVEAQLNIAYCYYNVWEFDDCPSIKSACEKLLAMPEADNKSKAESFRMLAETAVTLRNLKEAKDWCGKFLALGKDADPDYYAQIETRWQVLSNWEKMKDVPREEFNRTYAKSPLDPSILDVLPSISWAKPGNAKPLQVLVLCYQNGIREVAQLVQRMDMEPIIVTAAGREHFFFDGYGKKYPGYYAISVQDFAAPAARDVQKTFDLALDQTVDALIVAGLNWSSIPLPVREKMLKKAESGTPLIIKVTQPDELLKAATTNKISSGLSCVYPFRALPAFAGYPDRKAWQDGILERCKYGKGEIWLLKGYETPDYQLLTPGSVGLAGDAKLVEYDYYLALIIHLIREACDVQPPVAIQGSDLWNIAREAPVPLVFRITGKLQDNVVCSWTVRDRDNRIMAHKKEPLALKPGDNEIKYELGKLCGGEYFVDLQVIKDDKILAFGSTFVVVSSTNHIENVAIEKEVGQKDKIPVRIKLALPVKAPDLNLHVQRLDNYCKVVGEKSIKGAGTATAFSLPAADCLTANQTIIVELKQGDEVIDRRTVGFRLKDFNEVDRHAVLAGGAGEGSYLAEYLSAGYERAGVGKVLNNLVTELLDASEFSSSGISEFSFENPREGWIFVSGELAKPGPENQAWVWVGAGDDSRTMLEWTPGKDAGRQKETMRYLEAGKYLVYAGTQGAAGFKRLTIRAVPEIVYYAYPNATPQDVARTNMDWNYLKKNILNNVNLIVGAGIGRGGENILPATKEIMEWKQSGRKWFADNTVPKYSPTMDLPTVPEVYRYWTSGDLEMGYVDGLSCDEYTGASIPIQQQKFEIYCQAIKQISDNPVFRGKKVCPFLGFIGDCRYFKSSFRQISACRSKIWPECYLYEEATREKAAKMIPQGFDLSMEPLLELDPQPQRNIVFFFSPIYDTRCDVDYKVFLDMQLNYIANAPACAGLYGVGPWHCHVDEELTRWMGKLFRHYFIEGRRDLLSADPYELKHIKNPEFADGLDHWKVTAAEVDGVRAITPSNPKGIESRWVIGGFPNADAYVAMRRSAKAPNLLAQAITGLEKGRLYSVGFFSYQPDPGLPSKKHEVSVNVNGAEALPQLSSQAITGARLNWHFVVFRALADSAELSISDWKTPAVPGGKPGEDLAFDFIQVQPYLER